MKGIFHFLKPSEMTFSWTLSIYSYAYFHHFFQWLIQQAAAMEQSDLHNECLKLSEVNEVTTSSVFLYSICWEINNLVKFTFSGLSNFKFKRIPFTFRLGVDQTICSLKPQNFDLSVKANFLVALEKLLLRVWPW